MASSTLVQTQKQPPLSTEGKQFSRLRYTHTLEYYAAPKEKIIMKTLSQNGKKNTLGSILSEKSRVPNFIYTAITALYKFLTHKDMK